jgi:PAS domain S-box-containing protein
LSNKQKKEEKAVRKKTEAEEIVEALRDQQVDAIVGGNNIFMLRLKETEDRLKKEHDHLEQFVRERDKLLEDLRTHQAELEAQSEELRRTQQYAPVGYFTLDEHNRISEANLTGCRLLKADRRYILKKSCTKFMNPEESDKFYLHRKKVLESGIRQTAELKMRKADGTRFYAQLESIKAGEERLRLAIMDITERKEAEDTLVQQKIALDAANKELEAFSYSVSHDLRAPLRALEGFSEMVILEYGDKLGDQGKDYLMRIRLASQTMAQLIDDILKLSRLSQAEMHFDEVNLSRLAKSIINELRLAQPERQVEFIIAPALVVTGDRQLLQILLRNLLENAWKYTGRCSQPCIELGVTQQNGRKVYYIKDNGVGFNMQYKDKLFQPFQRLHSNKEFPGTGIGLALSQRIIRRHGGRIWAESETGKGATFYFTLE